MEANPARVPAVAPRLAFVDNIRWTVIAMVVLVHACVTYSGLGSWFYVEGGATDTVGTLAMVIYQAFSQAFFMGLLFFVAAAFIPAAYDRKGFARFIGERLVRLGVPSLLFMLVLNPAIRVIMIFGGADPGTTSLSFAQFLAGYRSFILSGEFLGASGPLWFALALLVFSVAYGLVRLVSDALRHGRPVVRRNASIASKTIHTAAAVLAAVIGLGSFLVRTVQPIGSSVLNMQLGYFTQYIVLFVAGLWVGRSGLLASLAREAGRVWLWLALAVGVPAWLLAMGFGGALSGNLDAYMGGWHWQAAATAAWEGFVCVALSLGLLVLYREKVNTPSAVTVLLSRTSFGIYVFHAPILVAVSLALRTVGMYAPLKALVAAAIAWLASLVVAWLVRSIPGVGKLFA